ncbi:M14 family zinc carboxypeptidase [Paenibacillus sp. NPDC057934]|uniref:M14 family zinc carboxypeptidase n=1 Tax=Paenibacillus sp. NPDC057934 TaxID=3346282 RepID=UPI0036DD7547
MVSFLLFSSIVLQPRIALASTAVVNPNQVYSYKVMQRDIEKLAALYPDLISYESLGQTAYGRDLWAVRLGRGPSVLSLNGSHHAREWMTTSVLMKMLDTYASAYYSNEKIGSYNVRSLLDSVSLWIVPMVNPDGVTLSQQGTAGLSASLASTLKKYNGNSNNFSRWKANMQGLDLNRQYPANWSTIKNAAPYPSYHNYKGTRPAQAPEVQMMMDFTRKVDPEITISYHSSGEIIFWNFNTLSGNLARDKKLAVDLHNLTGYSLVQPEKNPSGGGYKDWFIQEFKRPGFTIEIARYAGEGSVPLSEFNRIWSENKEVGLYSAKQSYDLWIGKQKVQYIQKTMSLLAGTELYFKIGAKESIAAVPPQEIKVIASKGDWYQVSTQQGNGWIHPVPGVLAAVETIAKTADLKVKTTLYKYPDAFAPKVSFLNPQTVQVKGKWGDWLLVSSGSGMWWMNGKGIEIKDPVVEEVEPSPEPTEAVAAPEQTPAATEELSEPAAPAAPVAP